MHSPQADLTGWAATPFTAHGITHDVFYKGEGPGVIVIPEVPGIHPAVLGLGNHLVDNGFHVAMPSLFGTPGRPASLGYAVATLARICVAKEFAAFATNANRPVAQYLRALAREVNSHTPGRGIGVIGMCFTGGFALAAAVDASVLAPVLSQPSVPLPLTRSRRRDPGVSEDELAVIADRGRKDGLCAMALRFSEDRFAPEERFATLRARLGDAFEEIRIDSSAGNDHGFGRMAHSVLTDQLREIEGHPALEARDRVVKFLTQRLTN
ncbi:dienelactone hydrolase family protein [Mycobacterium avium]|uniref:dienelactone hydrolase family protein n=1 Tax=Mycobacterium avium TaxID=1764 RepID=UPI001CC463AF|nr:dienelactone hydrolase family protein [Mycobacterium avium]MBZ4521850.1 dienelactone hydrolase [Mycobacterium avium subsp. hominissuis]MBZ4531233.1 dienelactone hydrolase [Mycobacterium avium subsp. hominissuis]